MRFAGEENSYDPDEAEFVRRCLAEGGFPAYTSTGNKRTALAVKLPLIYPRREV